MHTTYYKLSADPFRLSPDPRFSFPHRTYRKAMTYMRHALLRAEGFIIITAQPGMGKSTLIDDLLRGITPDQIRIARLVSTQLLADDLLRLVAYEFGLNPTGMNKAGVLNRVDHFLRQQHQQGRRTLLVVDEAQDVTAEALEELRLLTNMQLDGQQLLQIFLVGQDELREVVSAPELVQLHQRIIATARISPLNSVETKEYIKHRLRRVGWEGDPQISNQAFVMIHHFSRGIPRQINQICSRLLLHGSIEERHRLGLQDLKTVIDELCDEMLLPTGIQEVADTASWPSDPLEETYDERPRPAHESAAQQTRAAGAAEARMTDAGVEHRSIRSDAPGNTAGSTAAQNGADTAAAADPAAEENTADPQPEAHEPDPPATAHHDGSAGSERKREPWRMAVVILLIAGLLVSLLLEVLSGMDNRLRERVADLIPDGYRQQFLAFVSSLPEPSQPPARQAEAGPAEEATTVTEPQDAVPEPVSPPAGQADSSPGDAVSPTTAVKDTTPPQTAPQTAPSPQPDDTVSGDVSPPVAGTPDAAIDSPAEEAPAQGVSRDTPSLSGLEAELTEGGLGVEHLEDDTLKIKLSNEGIFEFNSAELNDTASTELKRLADILRRHGGTRIRIVGHTDSSGDELFNVILSQNRAKVVADYLVSQGLPGEHLTFEGRGDHDTRNESSTRNRPDLRRRIEVYVSPLREG